MKSFDQIREQLDEAAIEFLRNGLYADCPNDCPRYVHFAMTTYEKKRWAQEYQKGISCFKALFRANDDRYRLVLWNMIVNYYFSKSNFCKGDFSKEEYTFIQMARKVVGEPSEANVNPPIRTKRLVLRAIEGNDQKIFADHFKNEGDFAAFTGREPTRKTIQEFVFCLRRPTYFAIERRSDRKLLGYIGLSIRKETSTGLIEYYLFKDERQKGYCKEAVEALTKITLRGKLYEPVETVQRGIYRKKTIHLNAIRARISSCNPASCKTVERCGFVHEATIHSAVKQGSAWTDEEIYYLTYAMIQ